MKIDTPLSSQQRLRYGTLRHQLIKYIGFHRALMLMKQTISFFVAFLSNVSGTGRCVIN